MGRQYVTCEEGMSQYDDVDLKSTNIVDAVYVHARLQVDRGNPYIEALPLPRSEDYVQDAYTRNLGAYRYDDVKAMSDLDRMLAVGTLRELRFPLPFHQDLEFSMYNSLLTSYRARRGIYSANSKIELTVDGNSLDTGHILYGDSSKATNSGFSLIGYSGCGKSSAINSLVTHYPQVIMHRDDNGGYFPQITYLVVNCVPNSNFGALYSGIGDAIDKALNNIKPVYSTAIGKIANLGKKADFVRKLVEQFAVGIIIFDEIQLIDFTHTKENSFDSLLTLSNQTKVAIAVVGTEDARDKMFKELRTSRRVGIVINGNQYCENKRYFEFLTKMLFRYQWFDEPVTLTSEMVDALYDVTKGIVDQLISVYLCMHYEYLMKKKRPVVDEKYIRSVARKYYPGIQDVLANLESTDNVKKLKEIHDSAEDKINRIIEDAKQEKVMNQIMNTDTTEKIALLSDVTRRISSIYDEYSESMIEDGFKKVMKRKNSEGKTEKEISRLVIEELQKQPKRRNKKNDVERPDMNQMMDFLGIEEES